jgi:hypothetical protein
MIKNRYFILSLPNVNMSRIYGFVIGAEGDHRISLNGTKIVVKLPEGDSVNHGLLQNATEYTHTEISLEMNKPEWSEQFVR